MDANAVPLSYSSANHNANRIEEAEEKKNISDRILKDSSAAIEIINGLKKAEKDRDLLNGKKPNLSDKSKNSQKSSENFTNKINDEILLLSKIGKSPSISSSDF